MKYLIACFIFTVSLAEAQEDCITEQKLEERIANILFMLETQVELKLNYQNYFTENNTLSMIRITSKERPESDVIQMIDRDINGNFDLLRASLSYIEDFESVREKFEKHIDMIIGLRRETPSMLGNEPIFELARSIGYNKVFNEDAASGAH